MEFNLGYTEESDKSFDEVVAALEAKTAENNFRVLHTHDVQGTLAEKGFEREPYKIIEVCNAKFASNALSKSIEVGMFMPCKFVVAKLGDKTRVTLVKPSAIALLMPGVGLDDLANEVEDILKKVMEESL